MSPNLLAAISFLLPPTVMCLILVGIHCYLGLHVLARKVIFVDLALAQVAALGATVAMIFDYESGTAGGYFISLGMTLIAAAFFTLAGRLRDKMSPEAIIGIMYALASASVILLIDRMSHGAEHIKDSMTGQLLWVTWPEVIKVSIIYSIVSVVHYVFRAHFIRASFKGDNHWFWDLLFYGLFGVIITSSVQVAGVLLVFSFLIVPTVVSAVFFESFPARLFFGWALGVFLCVLGMSLSYYFDMPSGAFIVVVFTGVPILMVPLLYSLRKVGRI